MTDNLLKFSADLDRDQLLASQPKSELSCHVNIEPSAIAGGKSEMGTTANICLLFDCSFSMRGETFKTAIATAKMIVDILHERHWISLLAVQSRSYTVFENVMPADEGKEQLKNKIDKLINHLGGSTNLADGIENAMNVLSRSEADADLIVILSDGEADSIEKAQIAAEAASQKGIQIFAVGIGESYNAEQLLRLAAPSNGAVFGDSEGDKINDIFYNIINRIDRIYASKVILDFSFDERVQLKQVFRTSPERALYDSLTIDSDHKLELRVGNIENNKVYEFLLQIEVGQHDVGTLELIKARLQYDISQSGITRQQDQEIILKVNFTGSESPESVINENISRSIKKATILQLCNDLVQAFSNSDNARALQVIDELQQKCNEENNTALRKQLDGIKIKLENGDKVSDKERNDFLLGCTEAPQFEVPPELEVPPEIEIPTEIDILLEPEAPPEIEVPPEPEVPPEIETPAEPEVPAVTEVLPDAELYDFILIDPGLEPIRLLREIRNATNMGIPEIADIIKSRNCLVTAFNNKADAEILQERLTKIGAKSKIQVSSGTKEDKVH